MGFSPSCSGKKIIDYPLSKVMGSCRKVARFDTMIDNIDHPNTSKVCKCKGKILVAYCSMLKMNLNNVRFIEQLNYTLITTLVVLKTLITRLVKVEVVTTPCTL